MYLRCSNTSDDEYTIVRAEQKDLALEQFSAVEEREGSLPDYRFTDLNK